jgi:hypothetical protein
MAPCRARSCPFACSPTENRQTRYGWHYVGGIAAGFAGHGYRAAQNKRWIDTSADSVVAQGAVSGALHSNTMGYAFMAGKVAHTLLRYLPRA